MKSAVTISLVPEAKGGPFVFWDDLEGACAEARRIGFDAVEIFPPGALDAAQLRELLDRHGLKLAAIGTGAGWVKHKLRLTDADPAIRKRALEFAAGIIANAGQLGAPAIIGSMQGRWEGATSRSQAIAWLGDALEELAALAARHSQPLLFEPLNRYETNLFTQQGAAAIFLRELKSKNVLLLCDLFHMNIEEVSIADALLEAGPLVGHIHWADSNRRAMGLGHTDAGQIIAALRKIGFNGYLSAEVFAQPDSAGAARQSFENIRRWIS